MDKYTSLAIIVVAILFVGGYIYVNNGQTSVNTITVSGHSTAKINPDRVSIIVRIETLDDKAVEARDKNSEIVEDIKVALFLLGLDNEDITTEYFYEGPEYEWINNKRQLKDYKVIHNLKIFLEEDEFDKTGDIVDAVIDKKGYINYIRFELSDEKQAEAKKLALEQATRDAKEKAEAIALGADKKLGRLISLEASDFYYRPWVYYESGEAERDVGILKEAATNINPGEKDVQASVTATYKIR